MRNLVDKAVEYSQFFWKTLLLLLTNIIWVSFVIRICGVIFVGPDNSIWSFSSSICPVLYSSSSLLFKRECHELLIKTTWQLLRFQCPTLALSITFAFTNLATYGGWQLMRAAYVVTTTIYRLYFSNVSMRVGRPQNPVS